MSGLILTRRSGEAIKIGKNVTVTILRMKGNQVRVNVDAPREISVDREEMRVKKDQEPGFDPGEVK
jgi:carbon storage regulator